MDRVRVEVARLQHDADGRIAATAAEQRRDDLLRIVSVVGLLASCVALGLLAILRRRQHEASQRLFEGVMENAPVGLGILDTSLRIRHVNHALSKMSERALSAAPGHEHLGRHPAAAGHAGGSSRSGSCKAAVRPATEVEATSNTRADQIRSYQVNFYPSRQRGAVGRASAW